MNNTEELKEITPEELEKLDNNEGIAAEEIEETIVVDIEKKESEE